MTLAALPNYLQYLFFRPGPSWDPVSHQYAQNYAQKVWQEDDLTEEYLSSVIKVIGPVEGRRLLDLGGGPGQYSVRFAQKGADVTWHDVSRNYQTIVTSKAAEKEVSLHTSLGYLEDARCFLDSPFDVVFVRGCWQYCMNDAQFASLVYQLAKPNSWVVVWGNNSRIVQKSDAAFSLRSRFSHLLNDWTGVKIGHPYPPAGKIAQLFTELGAVQVHANYESPWFDDLFIKTGSTR